MDILWISFFMDKLVTLFILSKIDKAVPVTVCWAEKIIDFFTYKFLRQRVYFFALLFYSALVILKEFWHKFDPICIGSIGREQCESKLVELVNRKLQTMRAYSIQKKMKLTQKMESKIYHSYMSSVWNFYAGHDIEHYMFYMLSGICAKICNS